MKERQEVRQSLDLKRFRSRVARGIWGIGWGYRARGWLPTPHGYRDSVTPYSKKSGFPWFRPTKTPVPKPYDPVYEAKRYREVTRPRKGHLAGGQGGRRCLLDKAERGALLILSRIDKHIEAVDAQRIAKRSVYMPKKRGRKKGSKSLGRPGGRAALYLPSERQAIRAHYQFPARVVFCAKCRNDRRKNPDREGRCCVCLSARRRVKKRRQVARQRSEGAWATTHRIHKQRRRALIRSAPGNGVTAEDWRHVISLYGSDCLKCGSPEVTMDHVVPLAQGGHHDPDNLQPLCHLCNSGKCAAFADYRPFPYSEALR